VKVLYWLKLQLIHEGNLTHANSTHAKNEINVPFMCLKVC